MYKITIRKSAAKEIENLPLRSIKPVTIAILSLAQNPRPIGCKKLKGKSHEY